MPNTVKVIKFTDIDSDNTHARLIALPGPPVTVKDDNNGIGVHNVVGGKEIRHFRSYSRNFGSRPSVHYFRSVCLSVCLFVCSCRVFLSRV